MSSLVDINRPSSPSAASSSSVSTSYTSSSSGSSAHALIYTRDELLALATSPLSQSAAPPAVLSFPEIKRRTRRGLIEAYQSLDYARSTADAVSAASTPVSTYLHDRNPKGTTQLNPSISPRTPQASLPAQSPPSVWKVDIYVPPARRVESEQRVRPGRDMRTSRAWRRPVQPRAIPI